MPSDDKSNQPKDKSSANKLCAEPSQGHTSRGNLIQGILFSTPVSQLGCGKHAELANC